MCAQSARAGSALRNGGAPCLPCAQSGVRVTVLYDRVLKLAKGSTEVGAAFLAHVLAHEIARVLQGIVRHSEAGVMKAQWTMEDAAQMKRRLLPFAPEGAELIHLALGRGDCGTQLTTLAAAAPTPTGAGWQVSKRGVPYRFCCSLSLFSSWAKFRTTTIRVETAPWPRSLTIRKRRPSLVTS